MNRGLVIGLVVGCGLLASTREAKAGGVLAVDAHAAAIWNAAGSSDLATTGHARSLLGITAYGGYAFNPPKVYIQPEVGLTFDGMPADRAYYGVRGSAGLRLGLKFRIEPCAYAHIGGEIIAPGRSGLGGAHGALEVDAGLGADYRPIRWFTIGLTAGYQGLYGNRNVGKFHGIEVAPRISFWL